MATVETSMHFLTRDIMYEKEKPYQLKYAPEVGIPKTNFRLEKQDPITISNMRGQERQFSFQRNGFAVLKMDKEIPYEDFSDPEGIRRYLEAVSENLKVLLGANKVQPFQYVIRKRDPGFPIAKEGNYEFNQPSTVAHIDSTHEEARSTFRQVNGDPSTFPPNLRYQIVNVWKPLRGPLRDWPLALCDAASVREQDLVAADAVFEAKVTENMQVHYDAAHRWYYLADQEPSELLVFRQAESHPRGRVGVPHSSFPNPLAVGTEEPPRESIEVRTLVSYGIEN
ncbi:putative CmcJ-like methyltransferase [Usnea florida]